MKVGDTVGVSGGATIELLGVKPRQIRLGYDAPEEIAIVRDNAINREKKD